MSSLPESHRHRPGTLDALDARLLGVLRRDSRAKTVSIAHALGVPKSTVFDRLAALRRTGVRFVTTIDWEALGFSILVCFVAPYSRELVAHPNVNTALRLSPDQLFIEAVFASMREVEAFRESVPHARSYPVISVLKREAFVPDADASTS